MPVVVLQITSAARWKGYPVPERDIVLKIAAEARSIVDLVLAAMDITVAGTPPFVQFDDGTWVTEIAVAEPVFEQMEPDVASSAPCHVGRKPHLKISRSSSLDHGQTRPETRLAARR